MPAKRSAVARDLSSVLHRLEAAGTAQNRKVYRRHGAGEHFYGVSFKDLRAFARALRPDQALATDLWATGNTDARLLACMIADPETIDDETLDAWIGEVRYYMLVDVLVAEIGAKAPGASPRMQRWMASENEWVAQGGWDMLAHAAMNEESADEAELIAYLETIERTIHASQNRVRHAMNNALIAIGLREERLATIARAAAARIGRVEVDHGETNCKTPDAIPYMDRGWARQRARAAARA